MAVLCGMPTVQYCCSVVALTRFLMSRFQLSRYCRGISLSRFWLSRDRTDTLSCYHCSIASSLQITHNSLPHCTGSSSGNCFTHLNKILSDVNKVLLRKTPYLPSTKHNIKVTETGVLLNAMMAPQGHMITVYHITNIFYKYRRCTKFVRVSQTQTTTFIHCDPICIRF